MSDPKVSFVIPVAAPAPFLEEALRSVCAQDFKDWEMVLVVDGDAPDISQLARGLVPSARIRLVERPERGGIAVALNDGLRAARGRWIARLDADDRAHPSRLQMQMNYLTANPSTVLLGTSAVLVDEGGHTLGLRVAATGNDLAHGLLSKNRFLHSSVVFDRAVALRLGGYGEDTHLREDYELWIRLAMTGPVANLKEPLVDYRISGGQTSRGRPTRTALSNVWKAQKALAGELDANVWWSFSRRAAWRLAQYPGVRQVRSSFRRSEPPTPAGAQPDDPS